MNPALRGLHRRTVAQGAKHAFERTIGAHKSGAHPMLAQLWHISMPIEKTVESITLRPIRYKYVELNNIRDSYMDGTVKWYSKEKGYGYIAGADGVEYFFHKKNIRGHQSVGDAEQVQFQVSSSEKGPCAGWVAKSRDSTEFRSNPKITDERETCGSCGKKMVPRLITNRGEVTRSVCPYCANTHKEFGAGFRGAILFFGAIVLVASITRCAIR